MFTNLRIIPSLHWNTSCLSNYIHCPLQPLFISKATCLQFSQTPSAPSAKYLSSSHPKCTKQSETPADLRPSRPVHPNFTSPHIWHLKFFASVSPHCTKTSVQISSLALQTDSCPSINIQNLFLQLPNHGPNFLPHTLCSTIPIIASINPLSIVLISIIFVKVRYII